MTDTPPPQITDVLPLPDDIDDLPTPTPFYYVVGKDKTYIHKQFLFGRVLVPIKTIDHLATSPGSLWYDIPPLPPTLLGQIWSFFRAVWEKKHSEVMVYLTYKDGTYRVFVPRQTASSTHVDAKLNPAHIEDGWSVVGTVHSHCNFDAFHSGIDHEDAAEHDGLHITIGHVHRNDPSIALMIAANGMTWDFKLQDVTGQVELTMEPHPTWWERYILGEVEWSEKRHSNKGWTTPPYQLTPPSVNPAASSNTNDLVKPAIASKAIASIADEMIRDGWAEDVGFNSSEYYVFVEECLNDLETVQASLWELGIKVSAYASRRMDMNGKAPKTRGAPNANTTIATGPLAGTASSHMTDEDWAAYKELWSD
jgi:hypothetical protein